MTASDMARLSGRCRPCRADVADVVIFRFENGEIGLSTSAPMSRGYGDVRIFGCGVGDIGKPPPHQLGLGVGSSAEVDVGVEVKADGEVAPESEVESGAEVADEDWGRAMGRPYGGSRG